MKLKTSFFNPTVLKKDITRFAPLWGLYTIFMLLFLFFMWDVERDRFATMAPSIMQMMGVVNLAYAGIAAIMLFVGGVKLRYFIAVGVIGVVGLGGLILVRYRIGEVYVNENGHFRCLYLGNGRVKYERGALLTVFCREIVFRESSLSCAELFILGEDLDGNGVGLCGNESVFLLLEKLLYSRLYCLEFLCGSYFLAKGG